MKKASQINPLSLPFVGLAGLEHLPPIAGIYFVSSNEEIIYIGQSQNIFERWKNHHKYTEISKYKRPRIHFMVSDGRFLVDQESEYVNYFEPRLNSVIKRKPKLGQFPDMFFYVWIFLCIPAWFLFKHFLDTHNILYYIVANSLCYTGFITLIVGAVTWHLASRSLKERFDK